MARHPLTDFLSSYPFWLVDVGPLDALSLPIFNPLAGFSSVTAPEITIETESIQEANYFFDKKVLKRGSVTPMTLTKGVTALSTGFWEWTTSALTGKPQTSAAWAPFAPVGGITYRRNFMLVHFFRGPIINNPRSTLGQVVGSAERASLITGGVAATGGDALVSLAMAGIVEGLGAGLSAVGFGSFEFIARLPARAFLLYDCIPKRYKTGSDFDAKSGDISIAEVEFDVETFEEVNLLV